MTMNENYKPENKLYFSILGDSISTLWGYCPESYHLFYEGDICEKTGVCTKADTWWGQVLDHFDGELLVNNSWSGSRVTKLPSNKTKFPSGCSKERTSGLHKGDCKPDVVIVYLGTNDFAYGVPIENVRTAEPSQRSKTKERNGPLSDGSQQCKNGDMPWKYRPSEVFPIAYQNMIFALHENYPDAKIWCCTIAPTRMKSQPDWKFPEAYAGVPVEEYNAVIRKIAGWNREYCRLIDLYCFREPYDTIDGSHPTADGMRAIADLMVRSVEDDFSKQFVKKKDVSTTPLPFSDIRKAEDALRMSTVYASPEVPECRPLEAENMSAMAMVYAPPEYFTRVQENGNKEKRGKNLSYPDCFKD